MRVVCVDPSRIPAHALDAMLDFAYERDRMPWADRAFLEAARSLAYLHTRGKRRFFEAIQRVEAPTLLVQGACDRLAPPGAARQAARLRPDWAFAVLGEVGHLPMLEDPGRLVSVIDAWLRDLARSAGARAHEVA
ncbi:MAG: alpha/beta fold hydrolase [Egibacteraceae bacterium]